MKSQSELNQKNEALKIMSAEIVKLLKGEQGREILDVALMQMHGRVNGTYGDTGFARNVRVARDAQKDLIDALEAVVTKAKPHKQKMSDEKLSKVRQACRETEPRRRGSGLFCYEVKVGGEYVAEFYAKNSAAAAKFAKTLKLGKHELKRLTRAEKMNRSVAYATSPESEAYWSS
jgi:hypothetical protein